MLQPTRTKRLSPPLPTITGSRSSLVVVSFSLLGVVQEVAHGLLSLASDLVFLRIRQPWPCRGSPSSSRDTKGLQHAGVRKDIASGQERAHIVRATPRREQKINSDHKALSAPPRRSPT